MKKIFLVFSFLFLVGCGDNSVVTTASESGNSVVLNTATNLDIEVTKLDNGFKFKGYENKIVLLSFFASWCPGCKDHILQHQNDSSIYVASFDIQKNAEKAVDSLDLKQPVCFFDKGNVFADYYKIQEVPALIVLTATKI